MNDQNLVRAMTALGGGIASQGGACGALTGAIAFLGSVFGRDEPETRDDRLVWKASHEFYKRFEAEVTEKWGSINCRDITGVDWSDREQARAFYKGEGKFACADSTGKAAKILGEVLEKYLEEKSQQEPKK